MKKIINLAIIFSVLIFNSVASSEVDLNKCFVGNNNPDCQGVIKEKPKVKIVKRKTEQQIIHEFLDEVFEIIEQHREVPDADTRIIFEDEEGFVEVKDSILVKNKIVDENLQCITEDDGSKTCGSGEGWIENWRED